MEGNVVTAAKWLGGSMVLASAILVGGLRWVLSAVEWDRPAGPTPVQAGPPRGDLEELARSFRGLGPEADARPGSAAQPRSFFADPAPSPTPGNTRR